MGSKFYSEAAEKAAGRILEAFERPEELPKALKAIALPAIENHSASYSIRNQFLVWIMGYSDAAGFKQWRQYGRQVRKGEKAFHVLAPVTSKFRTRETDAETGEETERLVSYVKGWRGVAVFGLEQTDIVDAEKWEAYSAAAKANAEFLEALPWVEVARTWDLACGADGRLLAYGAKGCYTHGRSVEVGVENLATWAHELVHAADDRLGTLTKQPGQQPDNEIVAELGGAVLCLVAGLEHDADIGGAWEYINSYSKDPVKMAGELLDRIVSAVALIMEQAKDPESVIPPVAQPEKQSKAA